MKKILSVILMIAMIVSYFFPVKQVEAATPGTSELYWVLTVKKKAPIRNSNTAEGAVLTYAAKDTKLYGTPIRNEKGNTWYKVLYEDGNQTAYIYGGNVTDTGKKVTVTNFTEAERYWVKATKEAPLRYGFSEDFKTVAKTDNGEIMRCIGRCVNQYGNVFLKVEYASGKELFVYEKNVTGHVCFFVDFSFSDTNFRYCFYCGNRFVDTRNVKDQEIALRAIATADQIAAIRLNGMKEQQVYKLTNTYGVVAEAWMAKTVCDMILFTTAVLIAYPTLQELTDAFGTAVVRVMSHFDYQELKLADSYAVADVLEETYAVEGIADDTEYVYRKVKLMKDGNCCSTLQFVDATEMSLLEAYTYFTVGGGDVYCVSKKGAWTLAKMVGDDIKAADRICEIHNEDNKVGQFPHYHVVGYYVKKQRKYTTTGRHIFYGNTAGGYLPYENVKNATPNRAKWYR